MPDLRVWDEYERRVLAQRLRERLLIRLKRSVRWQRRAHRHHFRIGQLPTFFVDLDEVGNPHGRRVVEGAAGAGEINVALIHAIATGHLDVA